MQALRDGTMTVDMEDGVYYAQLAKAVNAGRVRVEEIDREVLRALAFKRRLGLFEKPYVPEDLEKRVRLSKEHRAAARDIARKSIVLLKNDAGLLPLSTPRRILVTGPLADAPRRSARALARARRRQGCGQRARRLARTRRRHPQRARHRRMPPASALDARGNAQPAMRRASPPRSRRHATAISSSPWSVNANRRAARPRIARASTCPAISRRLVDALVATGKPVVVVLLTGRALAVPALVEESGALLHAFFPGVEGGHAIADVLFGDYNPGGKQPVTWPRSVGQIPIHHYDPPNGRPNIPERGDYKAHWLDESDEPLFAFGFGLSYSRFTLEALELPAQRRPRRHAHGARARDQHSPIAPATKCRSSTSARASPAPSTGKRLQAYRRVHLAAHESRVVEFTVPAVAAGAARP